MDVEPDTPAFDIVGRLPIYSDDRHLTYYCCPAEGPVSDLRFNSFCRFMWLTYHSTCGEEENHRTGVLFVVGGRWCGCDVTFFVDGRKAGSYRPAGYSFGSLYYHMYTGGLHLPPAPG